MQRFFLAVSSTKFSIIFLKELNEVMHSLGTLPMTKHPTKTHDYNTISVIVANDSEFCNSTSGSPPKNIFIMVRHRRKWFFLPLLQNILSGRSGNTEQKNWTIFFETKIGEMRTTIRFALDTSNHPLWTSLKKHVENIHDSKLLFLGDGRFFSSKTWDGDVTFLLMEKNPAPMVKLLHIVGRVWYILGGYLEVPLPNGHSWPINGGLDDPPSIRIAAINSSDLHFQIFFR